MRIVDTLAEIKKYIKEKFHDNVVRVEFEGPQVVVYVKDVSRISQKNITNIAKELKKRIIIRPDDSVLMDKEETKKKIMEFLQNLVKSKEKVEKELGVTERDIIFDEVFNRVIIEAKKPGKIIGSKGIGLSILRQLIGWQPEIIRKPPIPSETISKIRSYLYQKRKEVRSILIDIGRKIHRPIVEKNIRWVRITALGGFREVGRSCLLLQTPESKVLIDCGVNVSGYTRDVCYPYLNVPEFNIEELDAVIITHAHLDHSAFVPYLFKLGYRGPVYCTEPTRDLMLLLEKDYLDVLEKEGKETPYDKKDLWNMIKYVIPLKYGNVTDISPDIKITMHNAGHILGSALVHIHIGEGLYNILYTGDLKVERTRLLEPAVYKFPRLETIIIEATYGGNEDPLLNRDEAEKTLINIFNKTIERGGKVLVPVFSVGRAQELLTFIYHSMENNLMKKVNVYLDGMVYEATAIHTAYPDYLNKEVRSLLLSNKNNKEGLPFSYDTFIKVKDSNARKNIIDSNDPCIILAPSGMMIGGPVLEYFKYLAEDEKNSLVFVGYQAEGTLGRKIQKGMREIPITEDGRLKAIKINMEVHTVEGFSGHSDRLKLLSYLRKLQPRPENVIIMHGEESKCINFSKLVYKTLRTNVYVPRNLDALRLK